MLNLDCRGDRVPLSRVALLGICLLLAAALPMAAPRGEHTQRTVPGKVGTKAPRFAATLERDLAQTPPRGSAGATPGAGEVAAPDTAVAALPAATA